MTNVNIGGILDLAITLTASIAIVLMFIRLAKDKETYHGNVPSL